MSAAGLGLRLHDRIYQSSHLRAFDQWWEHAETAYLRLDQEQPQAVTMYYDPLIDYHHELPAASVLGVAFYLMPHRPEAARRLWEWTKRGYGWAGAEPRIVDLPGRPRTNILGQLVAQELGEEHLAASFRDFAEEHYQPTWDTERGEHTWSFGLDEEHPRGQYNALLSLAEVLDQGSWSRLYEQPNLLKLEEPKIEGVDFPDLLFSRAWWDRDEQRLTATSVARHAAVIGRPTRFRVVGLDPEARWRVLKNGAPLDTIHFDGSALAIQDRLGSHDYVVERAM